MLMEVVEASCVFWQQLHFMEDQTWSVEIKSLWTSVQFDDSDIFSRRHLHYFKWIISDVWSSFMVFKLPSVGWTSVSSTRLKTFSVGQMLIRKYTHRDIFFPLYPPLLLFVGVPIFWTCETTRLAPVLELWYHFLRAIMLWAAYCISFDAFYIIQSSFVYLLSLNLQIMY